MNKEKYILNFIHDYFLIKDHIHLNDNYGVINLYKSSPGLFGVAEKCKIDVVQVYEIMREYRLNQLNKSVILTIKENI